jgi:hypothetical protein
MLIASLKPAHYTRFGGAKGSGYCAAVKAGQTGAFLPSAKSPLIINAKWL